MRAVTIHFKVMFLNMPSNDKILINFLGFLVKFDMLQLATKIDEEIKTVYFGFNLK